MLMVEILRCLRAVCYFAVWVYNFLMAKSKFISALDALRKERPIFHNEKDFQCSLMAKMEGAGFSCVRDEASEYGHLLEKNAARVDIVAKEVAVELKYPTAPLTVEHNGELYDFAKNPSKKLVDKGRYRFWRDVWRVEQLVHAGKVKQGYVIILTNRNKYWDDNKEDYWLANFNTEEGKIVSGQLRLKKEFQKRGVKWQDPLPLSGKYRVKWEEWSDFGGEYGLFRFLVLKVQKSK